MRVRTGVHAMHLPRHRWGIFCPFFGPLRAIVNSGQMGTIEVGPSVQVVQCHDVSSLHIMQRCWCLPLKPSSCLRWQWRQWRE